MNPLCCNVHSLGALLAPRRIKEFEDDPIKLATKENVEKANNPIQQWFNALDNPLNDGSGWFNPLKRQ